MDLEDLKKSWQLQSARLDRLEAQNNELRRLVTSNRINGSRTKLLRTYLIFVLVSTVMVPFVLTSFPRMDLPYGISVAFVAFFAEAVLVNFYVYKLIQEIDLTRLSVRDALRRVVNLERVRQRLRIVQMVIAIPILCVFFFNLYGRDHAPLFGGVIGGVIGGIIGIRKEFQIRAMIREMKKDLEDVLEDD